jgi:hypothetical protein
MSLMPVAAQQNIRTNSDWLYLDAGLYVCIGRVVVFNARKNILAAERVDKGGAT